MNCLDVNRQCRFESVDPVSLRIRNKEDPWIRGKIGGEGLGVVDFFFFSPPKSLIRDRGRGRAETKWVNCKKGKERGQTDKILPPPTRSAMHQINAPIDAPLPQQIRLKPTPPAHTHKRTSTLETTPPHPQICWRRWTTLQGGKSEGNGAGGASGGGCRLHTPAKLDADFLGPPPPGWASKGRFAGAPLEKKEESHSVGRSIAPLGGSAGS